MSTEEITPEEAVPNETPAPETASEAPEFQAEPTAEMAMPESPPASAAAPPSGAWPAKDVTDNDKLMAALAYATQVIVPIIVPAVMLLAEESRRRPFQKFHAIQSLGFLVAALIYEVLAAIVFTVLTVVTAGCLGCILWVLFFVPVVPAFYYAWQAYKGLYFKIPFLTDFMVSSKWLEIPAE